MMKQSFSADQDVEARRNIIKFEYKYIRFEGGSCIDSENTIDALNELGNQGWELVAHLKGTSDSVWNMSGFFKRRII